MINTRAFSFFDINFYPIGRRFGGDVGLFRLRRVRSHPKSHHVPATQTMDTEQ